MNPPIVGLTLNYRDARRTQRCVQSLVADGASHVLVWDNSADSGLSAAELRSAFVEEWRVSIVESSNNLGFAAGVNRGIDWIRANNPGAWVFLINNDALVLPGGLQALHGKMTVHPYAILVYPDIDHGGLILGEIWYQRFFALITRHRMPGSVLHASGCALLFAPQRWTTPLFDEDFFMYGEDVFLGWTHRGTGRLVHAPGVWVSHEGSASSGMASPFYEARLVAAHLQLARKMALNRWDYLFLLAGRALSLSARAVLRSFRYRSLAPATALVHGVRLAKRRQSRC